MKKWYLYLLCAMLAVFGTAAVSADGIFTDVDETAWYAEEVSQAYLTGLVNGTDNGIFSPEDSVSVAEAVTMAARAYSTYYGENIDSQTDGEWFEPYFEYAENNGIVSENTFDNKTRAARRHEVASLFANALPDGYYPAENDITSIPDIYTEDEYYDDVMLLYNAGVLKGNDKYGTFYPNSEISRAEAAAITNRIVLLEKRLRTELQANESYYLIDVTSMASGRNGLANAWLYDNKSGSAPASGRDVHIISDSSTDTYTALYRDFDEETAGTLTLEIYTAMYTSNGGIQIGFADANEDIRFGLTTYNGYFGLYGTSYVQTSIAVAQNISESYALVIYIDLDKNIMSARINNIPCGAVEIPDVPICRLVLGSTREGTGRMEPKQIRLAKNYSMFEHFAATENLIGETPCDFDVSGNVTIQQTKGNLGSDIYSAKIAAAAYTQHSAYKKIDPVSGKGIFESFILLPEKQDGAYFSLYSGDTEIVRVETKDGAWYAGDTFLRSYTANIWQTVRIYTDLYDSEAIIKICGKAVSTVDADAEFIDGIEIGFAPSADSIMWFDDITARNDVEYINYPSYPQVAESTDYNIGIHVCNLWRDSHSGEGWDAGAPFDELEPYLGFYEEGTPELADWEIKMMVEHGIDFQHMCWYAPFSDITEPIKMERVAGTALHDGFMNARYSNLMTFCLMWENNSQNVSSLDSFKKYLWSYWKEYYFSDPRYTVLDNCPVLTVWQYDKFKSAFGGEDGAKEAIAYMREDIKTLGYDDIILLFCDNGKQNTESWFSSALNLGTDAAYSYHFGTNGKSAEYQIGQMEKMRGYNTLHSIPAVSIGFNDVGRNETRDDIITPEDHKTVCEYIRDTALPAKNTGTWKDNTFFVSTWNEYTEGTYVMPSNIYGYAYLENIREVFTDNTSDHTDTDVKPTEGQKHRVTHMYPDKHQPVRWYQLEKSDVVTGIPTEAYVSAHAWDFSSSTAKNYWSQGHGLSSYSESGGVIKGTSTVGDYSIISSTLNIDINEMPYMHIRMKTTATSSSVTTLQLFFTTKTDTNVDEAKSVKTTVSISDDFVDYYIDMRDNYHWRGTLNSLRIDPLTQAGTFEISLIEFMSIDESKLPENITPQVKIDNQTLSFNFNPVILENGDFEVTADPRKGFFARLDLFHTWNRYTGSLMVESNEHRMYLTVGSRTAILDGKEYDLGYTFRIRDGLPVFQMKSFAEIFGYKVHIDGIVLDVQTVSDDEYAAIKARPAGAWEFERDGDSEGFTAQQGVINVKDGLITITPSGSDTAYISPSLGYKAHKYEKLVVGIVADTNIMSGKSMQMFFTRTGEEMHADRCYTHNYDTSLMTNGEIYEVEFNLGDSELWNQTISQIRIDPFNSKAQSSIAYIKLVEFE